MYVPGLEEYACRVYGARHGGGRRVGTQVINRVLSTYPCDSWLHLVQIFVPTYLPTNLPQRP